MKKGNHGAPAPAFNSIIPTTIDPRVFRKLESLCSIALQYGDNHPNVRDAIAALTIEMRKVSGEHLGHDGVDVSAISQLLRRTDPKKPLVHQAPAPLRDPVDILERDKKLDAVQVNAASCIREVWKAFGRCLTVSGRGYDRDGGGGIRRASALQPLDVMGEDTWDMYQRVFIPWYNRAKDAKVGCKVTGNVTKLQITFRVVVDEYFPEQVDKFMTLDEGTTLKVVQGQLARFFSPEPTHMVSLGTTSGGLSVGMVMPGKAAKAA